MLGSYRCLRQSADGLRLEIRLQPRAKRSGFLGFYGPDNNSLKWGVSSAPVENAANEELCVALAEFFRLPKRSVVLVSGRKSRNKSICLIGITLKQVVGKLTQLGDEAFEGNE